MGSGIERSRVSATVGQHVLLISHDVIGPQMAGPGIRYYHLARVLSREFEVLLAVPGASAPSYPDEAFQIVCYVRGNWASIVTQVEAARVIIFPSDIASDFPLLAQSAAALVVDGYDPLLAEWMTLAQGSNELELSWAARVRHLGSQYLLGDFFVCASERQRDWWLGLLEASGRINPYTFREDPSLRRLIDVVPYGLPERRPQHTRSMIKGVWPGIMAEDKLVLWGGGLWPWFDPLTAIRAVGQMRKHRPDVKLIFPGTRHPNPVLAGIPTHTEAAQALARQLGLLDSGVFFGDWIAYDDWPNVLLESDMALTLHGAETLEARLAFRSRVLEYIWADLPIVATSGDVTSELIAVHELGLVVPAGDVEAVAAALVQLLETPHATWEAHFSQARCLLTWERAVHPLVEFCRAPRRAPDKVALGKQLGNPFYEELVQLQARVDAYEQMRSVRLARRLHPLWVRLGLTGKAPK